MKKSTVRIFAIVLVVLMCLSLLPLATVAHAEEHVHVFEPTTIPPTCGEEGYVQLICEACGFGTDILEFLPPTGNHVFDNVVAEDYLFQDSDNICETPMIYWKSCIVCGAAAEEAYETAKQRAIDELNQRRNNGEQHSDEEWNNMLQRMLDEIWANYTFTYGGEGHQWVDVEYQPATCEQDGWETYHVCSVCGKEPDVIPLIPATGHRWGEFTVISEPTCETDGARTHVCSVCNKEETEAIPALGHKYGEFTVTKAPTCTEDGAQERVCSVCGAVDTAVIPALGHKFGAFTMTKAPTCTEDGVQEHSCTVCGAKETEAIPAAHKFGEYVVTVEPGCYSSGEQVRTCAVCGETESEAIPAAHKFGEFVVTMEPTCYSTGERRSTCTVCGEEIVEWIDMAHRYADGACVFCGEPDPNYDPNAAVAAAAQEPEVLTEAGPEEVTAAQTSAPEDGDSSIPDNETPITNKAEDNFALILNDTESFDNAGIQIGEDAVFDAGSDLFETPILQKGGVAVSEAVSGDTLTVYVKASPDAPAGQTYQYRWIRDTGSSYSLIPGATGSAYTLTDDDCGLSVYCSVNVYGKPNETELSTGVHARKEISMSFAIRPVGGAIGGNVKLEFTDTLHAEYIFEPITYPEGAGNSFTVSKIRDINGVERPLMTEDSLNITVEPNEHSSETEKGYYVRYVARNDTIIINTTSQKTSYLFDSLSPENDADVISVFFDLAECQPNEKESQGPTTESDQQIHNNTKIWEEFEKKYVKKDEQELPFPVVYYYVTPKWLGAPGVPMSSYEINAVGGFTFKLGLPSGVTAANFKDYNVKVYHYVNADWEQVSYTTDTTIAKGEAAVQINNFTNFSPFAVVARPTAKIEFVNEEPAKGHVSNEPITADDKGDVVLPKAEFTAQEGYTFACWLVDDKPMLPGETVKNVFADKKVYPKWMQGFTITFDDNDADNQSTYGALVTGEMDKQTVFVDDDGNYLDYKGDQLEAAPRLNEHAFQLKNHSFQGWSDKPGSNNTIVYIDKNPVNDASHPITGDITLYAVWKREQVSIIFNANGGSGTMDEQKGPVGGNITLTANNFKAPDENKMFAGWSKTVGGNVDYKNQATIDVPDTDTTLYAVWREKVTVRFNPKSTSDFYGGTGSGTMAGRYYPSGATVTLPKCEFTAPEGKAFAFWSDRQDGSGNIYPDKYEGYWTGNTELFAQWGDKLTIHYNPNGGDGSSKAQVAAQNVDVTLATAESAGFSRSGYRFLGWDTIASKKSNPKYAGGETVKGGFDQDDVTLYAIWDQVEITGVVVVTGSLSGIDSLGFVGETLTAEVFNEKKFTDFTYEWTDDDGNVLGTQSTYTPTINDFGKTIVCTVTAHSPYESKETSNEKTIGIDEQDKRIINDGVTEKAYVYGLYPGMYYSTDGGKTKARVDKVPFELSRAGVYYFYANNTDNTILAVVNVENWYTIGYAYEGSGTVRLTLGNTAMTNGTRFTGETAEYIEYYPGVSGYTQCWIVKEGANIGSFTLTVSPGSSGYAHVKLNDKLIDSFGSSTSTTKTSSSSSSSTSSTSSSSSTATRTYTVNTPLEYDLRLTSDPWKMFDIVFNNNASTSPRTADESNLGLWSALCLMSLTGSATILGKTFKRKKTR